MGPLAGDAAASWYIALSGAIPALVAMWVVDRMDRKRPEPPRLRRLVAVFGMLAVIPAIFLEVIVASAAAGSVAPDYTYQGATFKSFVIAAAIEEACKIVVVYWIVWRRPELDERLDGIVYACRAGLGFALVENVLYLTTVNTVGEQMQMWILRAVLSVPGHALWTGMIGGMAARRRFDRTGLGLLGGYLLAVAFHGLYDVALFVQVPLELEGHARVGTVLYLAPLALTVAAFLVVRTMARDALRLDDAEAATAAAAAAAALRGPG